MERSPTLINRANHIGCGTRVIQKMQTTSVFPGPLLKELEKQVKIISLTSPGACFSQYLVGKSLKHLLLWICSLHWKNKAQSFHHYEKMTYVGSVVEVFLCGSKTLCVSVVWQHIGTGVYEAKLRILWRGKRKNHRHTVFPMSTDFVTSNHPSVPVFIYISPLK